MRTLVIKAHHTLQVPDMAPEDVHRAVREAYTSQQSWAAVTAKVIV